MRYCLVPDESGHWYVIPADRADDYDALLYPEGEFDWDAWEDALGDWIKEVDGPQSITFENYK